MIHEVGNIELCELLETEPKAQVQSMFIILGHWHRLLHVRGTSCAKEERKIRNSSSTRWTSFPIPDYVIKKETTSQDTDTVRSRETGNTTSPIS